MCRPSWRAFCPVEGTIASAEGLACTASYLPEVVPIARMTRSERAGIFCIRVGPAHLSAPRRHALALRGDSEPILSKRPRGRPPDGPFRRSGRATGGESSFAESVLCYGNRR